jgi:hypothetical protein
MKRCERCGVEMAEANIAGEYICPRCSNGSSSHSTRVSTATRGKTSVILLVLGCAVVVVFALSTRKPDPFEQYVGKPSIFGFNWGDQPKDIQVLWLPRAFDNGEALYSVDQDNRVREVIVISADIPDDDKGTKGKALFQEVQNQISQMVGNKPKYIDQEGDYDSYGGYTFYHCLESGYATSLCHWTAGWDAPDGGDIWVHLDSDRTLNISESPVSSVDAKASVVSRRVKVGNRQQ